MAKKKVKKKEDVPGLFIPAGLFVGIGIGLLTGEVAAGTVLGLGAGFLLMAIVKMFKRK